MVERRQLLKAAIASPLVAVGLSAAETEKQKPPVEPMFTCQKVSCSFPSKVVSMMTFRDRLFVATEYDGVYEITGE